MLGRKRRWRVRGRTQVRTVIRRPTSRRVPERAHGDPRSNEPLPLMAQGGYAAARRT